MKRSVLIAIFVGGGWAAACQEPDPNYGDPNGIIGKRLPNEGAVTTSGAVTAPPQTESVAAKHADAGGPPLPIAEPCFTCHGTSAPALAFGGYVATAGKGAPNIVLTVGATPPVSSDKDGYFWSLTGTIAQNDKAAAGATSMNQALTGPADGNCTQLACHGDGAPGGIIHP